MTDIDEVFRTRLRVARLALGLSFAELASRASIGKKATIYIEDGRREIRFPEAVALATAVEASLADLCPGWSLDAIADEARELVSASRRGDVAATGVSFDRLARMVDARFGFGTGQVENGPSVRTLAA